MCLFIGILIISFFFYRNFIRKKIARKIITLPIAHVETGKFVKNPYFKGLKSLNKKRKLVFSAKYMNLNAGTAEITIEPVGKKDPEEVKITSVVKTTPAVASIYSLDAKLVSRIHADGLVPLVSTLTQTDTFSKIKRRTLFDYSINKIHFLEKGFRIHQGDYVRELELPLKGIRFDELSAILLFSQINIVPHSSVSIPVISNRRFYKVTLNFNDYKYIQLPELGRIKALEATATVLKEGKAYPFGDLKTYFSTTHGNIPVLMTGKIKTKKFKLGEIRVALKEIKN